jgi:hypothetical protein
MFLLTYYTYQVRILSMYTRYIDWYGNGKGQTMSRLEDKVAVVIGVSAIYVECVQPVKAGDVPVISKAVAVDLQAAAQSRAAQAQVSPQIRSAHHAIDHSNEVGRKAKNIL